MFALRQYAFCCICGQGHCERSDKSERDCFTAIKGFAAFFPSIVVIKCLDLLHIQLSEELFSEISYTRFLFLQF